MWAIKSPKLMERAERKIHVLKLEHFNIFGVFFKIYIYTLIKLPFWGARIYNQSLNKFCSTRYVSALQSGNLRAKRTGINFCNVSSQTLINMFL